MNFDFSEEQLLLRDQARKFLSERAAPSRVRRILETDAPYDRELWDGLAEMAWPGTAIPEAHGGAGYGYLELCVIAEELGRSLAPTPFSSSVYLATEAILLAGTEDQKKRWLPKLATGQAIGCLAVAEGPQAPRPGSINARATGGQLTGVKVPVADGDVADLAVVLARTADGGRGARAGAEHGDDAAALFLVDLHAPGVARTRGGDDRSHALARADRVRGRRRRAARGARRRLGAGRADPRPRRRPRSPSSRWAAPRPPSTWPASTRWGASPSAAPSPRSRPSSTSWSTSTSPWSWRAPTPTTPRGPSPPTRPSCPWPPPPRGSAPPRPSSSPPRRTSRPTAAWASPGSSTATCTIAAPSSWPSPWAARAPGRTGSSRASKRAGPALRA